MPKERRLARNKCLASLESVYAVGGYKTPLQALAKEEVFEVVVVSGAGPQFEAEYLDYACAEVLINTWLRYVTIHAAAFAVGYSYCALLL